MIEFVTDIDKTLPYNRRLYVAFLYNDSPVKWYGVSLQLPGVFEGKDIGLARFIEVYEPLFKNILLQLDNSSLWIVNHDNKDLEWFPNDDNTLSHLRSLFKQRNITNGFKGALVFTKNDLLEFLRDLISYPYAVFSKPGLLYKNLDISHGALQFIIKISHHLTIDLLSTDMVLLKKVVNENASGPIIVREYDGTNIKLQE